ncbi:tRNA threonylcarbamoyladenosine biosynthesis protein TsaB [Entomobacter blattae]|uniref:Glycoprotease family protein n=1 Tax=Entomobacter blattae TaxID=2762277 RepID=A0A7H1NP06_9PROT|nr:hypothetical protein [Entomobacter blattae]QNT77516.1 Glycoprotease family protein [Entomobacter blattae]
MAKPHNNIFKILVMNAASVVENAEAMIALAQYEGETVSLTAVRHFPVKGVAENLAVEVRTLIEKAHWSIHQLDMVIVVTGPGSFTGVRATMALAAGLGLGSSVALVGLGLGEVMIPLLMEDQSGRFPVCVIQARRNRLFVLTPSEDYACPLETLYLPQEECVLAGDGMTLLRAFLHQESALPNSLRGEWDEKEEVFIAGAASYRFTPYVTPTIEQLVIAGLRKYQEALAVSFFNQNKKWLDFHPHYIDPPEAKRPQSGLRPAPEP